jgi:hypothetical protein
MLTFMFSETILQEEEVDVRDCSSEEEKNRAVVQKRSRNHRLEADVNTMAKIDGRVTRAQWKERKKGPPKDVSLAFSEFLPDVVIHIETLWIDEVVLDKRKREESNHYEYLIKPKWMGKFCAKWKFPNEVQDSELVRVFEEKRVQQIKDKRHLAAWYPFKEELVVQWKDYPFFIVSYGGGQFNKFCIVGLDKTRTALKCKNAHLPNQSLHQVHVQMVEKEMNRLGLCIHHKTISPANDIFPPAALKDTTRSLSKPISQHRLQVESAEEIHKIRCQLHQNSSTLPIMFAPVSHPRFCKCETEMTDSGGSVSVVCQTGYKLIPDAVSKPTTLWLPHGPPITDRRAYVWRCKMENPACNVFYDGYQDGIFNYSNSTMVSHSIMFEFLFGMITGYGKGEGWVERRKRPVFMFVVQKGRHL